MRRRLTAGLVIAVALIAVSGLVTVPRVSAQAALPFVAYGTGLQPGQVVEAQVREATVARATVDARGNWRVQVDPRDARDGDAITFMLDGATTGQSVTFRSGHVTPPPGIALTSGTAGPRAAPTPTPTPNAAPAGTPAASPRPSGTPSARCTFRGRRVPCAPSKFIPPASTPTPTATPTAAPTPVAAP